MPEFLRFAPEANFGHYLMMAGALGARACAARARRFSEYENGIGTGHVHLWFSPADGGWARAETHNERRTETDAASA
ncbi:aromatic ring-opening dioxygenase domain protein [Burkholderia pseudomallei MSHR733]|nr:aromatic ring-opening dioxygenase domain protein [Burkholderia pseudomallei MSHR733]